MSTELRRPARWRGVLAVVLLLVLWLPVRIPTLLLTLFHWAFGQVVAAFEELEIWIVQFAGWISGIPEFRSARQAAAKAARREKVLAELRAEQEESP